MPLRRLLGLTLTLQEFRFVFGETSAVPCFMSG